MVQWGEKINMNDFNETILNEYKDKLISILLDDKRQNDERELMMLWARKPRVGNQWQNSG